MEILEQIHDGHQGMQKCMLKARESLFWPGIRDDIWEAVEKCGSCQSTSKATKPVRNVSEVPPHVWHTLGTDLFYWNKMDYIVVGDSFTKYLIARKLPNSSTHSVIKEIGMIFTWLEWPFVLKGDKGPCYISREYYDFLAFYKIHHITSSPNHPQSNRFAEALVGILKKLTQKSIKDWKPFNYGLLEYRVTPIAGNFPSLLETLWGCRLRTLLHQIPSSVGKAVENSRMRHKLIKRQPSTSNHFTMELKLRQPVFVKEVHGNVWKSGVINQLTKEAKEPESYWVKFPIIPCWEGLDQWSRPNHNLPILNWKMKAKNGTGHIPPHWQQPFNSKPTILELPSLPMESPVPAGMTSKATPTVQGQIPVSSTSVTQCSISSDPAIPNTPRESTRSTNGIPPVRSTPSKKWAVCAWNIIEGSGKGYFCIVSTY